MAEFEWTPYCAGETAVDFGHRYLCVDAFGARASVRDSHNIPQEAAWIVRLVDLVKTTPDHAPSTGQKRA
jgi:hypothetical protein